MDMESEFKKEVPRELITTEEYNRRQKQMVEDIHKQMVEDIHKQMVFQSSVLDKAQAVIYGEREQTYGSPDKNLRTIAAYWSNHLRAAKGIDVPLTVDDVSVMMILLKAARLANTPKHEDSLVDICGYAALADRCNKESTTKK